MTRAEPTDCVRCAAAVPDLALVCHRCATGLRQALVNLAAAAAETHVDVAKLARHADMGARGGAEVPLPYSPEAADAAWAVGNTVVAWTSDVAYRRGQRLPAPLGRVIGPLCPIGVSCRRAGHESCDAIRAGGRLHPIARAAVWLAGQVGWLRHQTDADQAWDELLYAAATVQRTVQGGGVDRWYAGPCGEPTDTGEQCTADLYVRPGALQVRCQCGAVHDATARKAWLLGELDDVLVTAAVGAAAATMLGHSVTAAAVRDWARRGTLVAHGVDRWAHPTYRLGEILAEARRREANRARTVHRRRHDVEHPNVA